MGKKTLVSKSYFTSVNDHIFIRKEEIRCCSILASHFIGGVFSLNSSEPEDIKWHNLFSVRFLGQKGKFEKVKIDLVAKCSTQ